MDKVKHTHLATTNAGWQLWQMSAMTYGHTIIHMYIYVYVRCTTRFWLC